MNAYPMVLPKVVWRFDPCQTLSLVEHSNRTPSEALDYSDDLPDLLKIDLGGYLYDRVVGRAIPVAQWRDTIDAHTRVFLSDAYMRGALHYDTLHSRWVYWP